MPLELVPARPDRITDLARIVFEAFKTINERHGFPLDIADLQTSTMVVTMLTTRPDFYGLAAILDGKVVGCNFAQLSDEVAGIGPICVDPGVQAKGIGRRLMKETVSHCLEHHSPMVRLLQDSFNMASLSLYTSLGYTVQEPVVLMQVAPANEADPTVRPLTPADLDAADQLCRQIYKVSRKNELAAMIVHGSQAGCIPHGRFANNQITASLIPGFFGYGVARSDDDLLATAQQAARTAPPPLHRIFIPARNGDLFRNALHRGFKSIKLMSLMSIGPYQSPTSAWSPSIEY